MSTAAESFINAARAIFSKLGEGAVYSYWGTGTISTLTAVHAQRIKEEVEGYGAAVAQTMETISLLYEDLTRLPQKLDTITLTATGVVYTVQYLLYNDGYVVKVAVTS